MRQPLRHFATVDQALSRIAGIVSATFTHYHLITRQQTLLSDISKGRISLAQLDLAEGLTLPEAQEKADLTGVRIDADIIALQQQLNQLKTLAEPHCERAVGALKKALTKKNSFSERLYRSRHKSYSGFFNRLTAHVQVRTMPTLGTAVILHQLIKETLVDKALSSQDKLRIGN